MGKKEEEMIKMGLKEKCIDIIEKQIYEKFELKIFTKDLSVVIKPKELKKIIEYIFDLLEKARQLKNLGKIDKELSNMESKFECILKSKEN